MEQNTHTLTKCTCTYSYRKKHHLNEYTDRTTYKADKSLKPKIQTLTE